MRIVYVTAQAPFGPREVFFLPEVQEFRRQGHEVLMLPLRPAEERPVAEWLPAIHMPIFAARTLGLAALEACRHPLRLARLMARLARTSGRPRALLKNLVVVPKALAAARAVRAWRPDHLHAHWASTPSTMAYLIAAWCELPWSFTMHRWDIAENNMLAEKIRTARFARVINERGLATAAGLVGPELARKCRVLHMGVQVPAQPAPAHGPERPFILACPANMIEVKGHRFLLEACRLLHAQGLRVACWLIGDGPLEAELRSHVTQAGLDGVVTFKGRWSHDEVLAAFQQRAVDAVVVPSIVTASGEHEGIPVALMEAMAAGLPVVATETGGIPELLAGGAGLLVPERDAPALAQAIERLVRDPAGRDTLGRCGYERVVADFHLPTVVRALAGEMAGGTNAAPLVSVVTPTFNSARFVGETLRSVAEQTYPHVEHLVIDGGSTDETLEVVRRAPHARLLADRDDGMYEAINKGLRLAQGEIIGCLNSDDLYLPDTLSRVVAAFAAHPEADVIFGHCRFIDEAGRTIYRYEARPFKWRDFASLRFNSLAFPSVFWRRRIHERIGYFDEGYKMAADFDFYLRFKELVLWRFDETLSCFRIHASTLTNTRPDNSRQEVSRILAAHGIPDGPWVRLRQRIGGLLFILFCYRPPLVMVGRGLRKLARRYRLPGKPA